MVVVPKDSVGKKIHLTVFLETVGGHLCAGASQPCCTFQRSEQRRLSQKIGFRQETDPSNAFLFQTKLEFAVGGLYGESQEWR
jgi:hypothetical protein